MTYQIEMSSAQDFVALTHYGEVPLSEMELGRAKAVELMREQSCQRLLVDVCGMTNTLSTVEHFEFTAANPRILPAGAKVAVLVRKDALPDALFAETVAVNRGVKMNMFTDKQQAVCWLLD